MKNSGSFHISAQNIDCGYLLETPRRGGSNEYPQYMFLSSNKEINVYTCKPKFFCIKFGFKGLKLYRRVFVMIWQKKKKEKKSLTRHVIFDLCVCVYNSQGSFLLGSIYD